MEVKAVIFDFNGTLFDDTEFHMETWKRYIEQCFGLRLSDEEIHRRCIGPDNKQIFTYFSNGRMSAEEMEMHSRKKETEYRRVARSHPDKMHLIDGAPELFDLLRERGIPVAMATASIRENVDFYLGDLGLHKWLTIDRVVYEEGKLASKPDPAFYLEAARRLNLDPGDCLIVEDSRAGIQAAIASGAGRVVAMDRTTPREWLESNPGVYGIIHDFHGFERFLV